MWCVVAGLLFGVVLPVFGVVAAVVVAVKVPPVTPSGSAACCRRKPRKSSASEAAPRAAAAASEAALRETADEAALQEAVDEAALQEAVAIPAPTNGRVLLGDRDVRGAASLAGEQGLRASAFGRLPKVLLLDCWTYLDLESHIAFTSAARWTRHLAVANPRFVSPRALSVRSADGDPGFERAIRRYHPRRLWCRPRGHNSFDWMAGCAPTLTELKLQSSQPVVFLAALESLTALTALDVECAHLGSQLQYISGLTRLERLRLCGATDHWNALQKLENLTSLHLSTAASDDISAVAHMPRLTTLALTSCMAALNLQPLAACRALTSLAIEADGADLTPIGACSGLTSLDFSNSAYTVDATYIRSLVGLRRLAFGASGVDGLEALRGMRQLEYLAANGWQDASLDPLRGCLALCYLSISNSPPLADISALACLTNLQHLKMRSNRLVRDIAPIANLPQLVTADLGKLHNLVDIRPIAGLTALTVLRLDGCDRVSDLQPIAGLTQLRVLGLPERGRHPIDWSVVDRLSLLGEPVNELVHRGDPKWYRGVDAQSFVEKPLRQPQWPMSPPTHHSHAHPLVLGRDHFGHSCNWCSEREGGTGDDVLDTTYRCDVCDYDLCEPCHEKLRVKPRRIPAARESSETKTRVPSGRSREPNSSPRAEATVGLRDAWCLVLAEMAGPTRELRRLPERFVPLV
jgi:Leucine-rich repeat (LRR) protein